MYFSYLLFVCASFLFELFCKVMECPNRWSRNLQIWWKIWNRKSFIKPLKIGPHDPKLGQNIGFICTYLHANSGWNPNFFDLFRIIFLILTIFGETTVFWDNCSEMIVTASSAACACGPEGRKRKTADTTLFSLSFHSLRK